MMEELGITSKTVQDSYSMYIGEDYNLNEAQNIPGFKETTNFRPRYASEEMNKKKKKNTIAKFFSDLSRFGMSYEDDVINNMRAVPADKNLISKQEQFLNQDLFSQLSSSWKVKSNADKNFFEKDFPLKRDALRKLAVQPELEDILDTMTNESIVYDSDFTYFAEPFIEQSELAMFNRKSRKKIENIVSSSYAKLYKMLDWKYRAWDDFKRFLVEGILAWEIVYDSLEKPTRIIGLVPLDPATLTKKFENNKFYWLQYKGVQGKERKLLDAQVVYIAYQETNIIGRVSYLERLIRPFNIYRIIEQAQLIWTVTNSAYKTKFTIPIKGMNKTMGMQTLSSAMNRYKEDIKFLPDTGELTINGQVNLPFNKEYWMPESDSGSPEIEVLGGDGPELNDNDQLKFFKNQLYKISKIPLTRFDQESGETWFGTDPTSTARVEIDFARFVNRLRNVFAKIILKPLQIQLALSIPELADNRDFLDSISLQYKSYNLFEEMMELELTQKRVEFIQAMKESMMDMDTEGNEIKFFSSKFLVKKYLKLSDKDLELNDKMKQQEIEDLNLAGGESNSYGDEEGAPGVPGEAEGNDLLNQPENPDKNILNDSKKDKKKSPKKKSKIITEPDNKEEE